MANTAAYALSYILTDREYDKLYQLISKRAAGISSHLPEPRVLSNAIESHSKAHTHSTALEAVVCKHDDCLPATVRASSRTFAGAYALVALVEAVVPGIFRRQGLATILKNLANKSSARFAMFVASYTIIYRSLLRSLPVVASKEQNDNHSSRVARIKIRILKNPHFAPFLAGAVAGSTMLFDHNDGRRVSVSLYVLTKTAQFLYNAFDSNGYVPEMPRWWGSWIIFSLSSGQLISAFLLHPDTFPRGYANFITSRSTTYLKPRPEDLPVASIWPTRDVIVENIRSVAEMGYPSYRSPLLYPDSAKLPAGLDGVESLLSYAHPSHERLMCALLHPEDPSCSKALINDLLMEMPRAIRFMAIVYGAGALLRWKRLRSDPEKVIARTAVNAVSAGFSITMALATAWSLICFFQRVLPGKAMKTSRFFLNGFIAGSWVLADRNRTTDVALYSARLSLLSFWKVLTKQGKVRSIRNGEVVYFSICMGILMALYEQQRDSINSSLIRKMIGVVLGR